MDLLIENKLLEYKTHIIDYATLKSILTSLDYVNINDKIVNLKRKKIIQPLKKGFYIHNSQGTKNIISKELLSNILLDNPSCISLDYALSFHGLIPESIHEVTAVTPKRSKSFKTNIGVFSYKHIKIELFRIGIKIESSKNANFLIAGKEKAICDKIYLTTGIQLASKVAMIDFLESDLRIDIEDLEDFDIDILAEYFKISKSKKIQILLNLIKEL
jgi:predicted transcriptional regulator of viral defense system